MVKRIILKHTATNYVGYDYVTKNYVLTADSAEDAKQRAIKLGYNEIQLTF